MPKRVFPRFIFVDMKPELLETAHRLATDEHRSASDRWSLLELADLGDVAELGIELISGALELVLGALG